MVCSIPHIGLRSPIEDIIDKKMPNGGCNAVLGFDTVKSHHFTPSAFK